MEALTADVPVDRAERTDEQDARWLPGFFSSRRTGGLPMPRGDESEPLSNGALPPITIERPRLRCSVR